MGFWSSLLKYGGKAARGTGHVIGVTGKTLGSAALHPQRTLMGAGKAMQTAAVGSAAGYVTWEKLTTDKSVARIVGDAVGGGYGNRLCHWVGRGAWHLPDHPLRQIRSDI